MATMLDASQQEMLQSLTKKQARLTLLERYYDGDAPLPEGAEGQSRAYRRFQRKSRLNLAQLSVSAVRERMRVSGFRTGLANDENGDDEARRLWKASNLYVKSADLHNLFLKFGEAYAIVGFPAGREYPLVTVEDPRQVHAMVSPEDPTVVLSAIKVFTQGYRHMAYFYYANEVLVYSKASEENIFDVQGWALENSMPNPLGEVPVVYFENADGRGEYEAFIDIIDRVNHMILQRLVIATTQAFKQKWISGDFPTHDADGNEIDYNGLFESSPGSMWVLPPEANLGELDQSSIQDIILAVRADIQDFAAVTRTPMHYLSPDGSNQSAEGASLSREGLVFKTEDRIARVSSGWSKVMNLMFRWIGDEERASLLDLEPMWHSPERHSLAERADANSKFQDVPFRSRMKLVGQFTPAEVAEMEIEQAGDAILAQAIMTVPAQPGETAAVPAQAQEAKSLREQAEALGAFIRAGVTPETAAAQVGLTGLEFIDAMPITLKPKDLLDAETQALV